jgi:hypothetical protein
MKYLVLAGKMKGRIVEEDNTCICERCEGSGTSPLFDLFEPCEDCKGVGRVLGYPDIGRPIPLSPLKDGNVWRVWDSETGVTLSTVPSPNTREVWVYGKLHEGKIELWIVVPDVTDFPEYVIRELEQRYGCDVRVKTKNDFN